MKLEELTLRSIVVVVLLLWQTIAMLGSYLVAVLDGHVPPPPQGTLNQYATDSNCLGAHEMWGALKHPLYLTAEHQLSTHIRGHTVTVYGVNGLSNLHQFSTHDF